MVEGLILNNFMLNLLRFNLILLTKMHWDNTEMHFYVISQQNFIVGGVRVSRTY